MYIDILMISCFNNNDLIHCNIVQQYLFISLIVKVSAQLLEDEVVCHRLKD